MKKIIAISLLTLIVAVSCSKKEIISDTQSFPKQWEKYVGNYRVYDTLGNFMYDMDISHYTGISPTSGYVQDSILIQNFADTFDLKFQFVSSYVDLSFMQEYLDILVHDSLKDYNNKTWFVGSLGVDTTTTVKENSLINDTIVLYFEMDNIKYYINEAQPYYRCECKHVAVKQ